MRIITVICLSLLAFFLWWHLQMSFTRYFDVDEFAHMSWTAHWVAGQRPYVDFFTFFPPGFMLFLAPLFVFGNTGVFPILAARFFMFLTYVGILGSLGYLFWLTRKSWLWTSAVVILAFLPLPMDKFIEIRPDSLATLLGLISLIFQIRWMRTREKRDGVIAGALASSSLLVLPKMVPQIAVAALIAVLAGIGGIGELRVIRRKIWRLGPPMLGFAIPAVLFGLWVLTLGDIGRVFYSLIKLPVEANKISEVFIMLPNLFFYPNGIFYGENGYPMGLKLNHIIWVIGLFVGAYRLVTPFLTREKQYVYEEMLLSGIFYVHVIFYVLIVPLKHTQYLIPIVIFVAYYAADFMQFLWQNIRRSPAGLTAYLFCAIIGAVLLFEGYYKTNITKLSWTNTKALTYLQNLYKTVPKGEYILDLDGRTMYYPYPYFACCIPFGQSSPYLTRPLPSLTDALERTKTKYIYQGELKRVDTLRPEDQTYIQANYHFSNGDSQLLVRNQ